MRNIAIFGGTGDVGEIIVNKLLTRGNIVKVLSRNLAIASKRKNVHFIIGNVLQVPDVQKCVEVGDSVIITLGFNNSREDTMSRGTKNIISVMLERKCNRLLCLSAQGAGDSWETMPQTFKDMVLNDPILKASFKDHSVQEDMVKSSNLTWTIVRSTEIVATPESGKFIVNGFDETLTYQISKYDVAQFMVDELYQNKYVRQFAMITS